MSQDNEKSRRRFLVAIGGVGAAAGVGFGLGTFAKAAALHRREEKSEGTAPDDAEAWIEVAETPIEDLMEEHAVLERVLLVYEECASRLESGKDFDPDVLSNAAGIVRRYIEDHHERDEETHIFPRLDRIGAETDLIKTLLVQHEAGRHLTTDVLRLATLSGVRDPSDRAHLVKAMRLFIRMYRPHAARENTVLFPALRKALSQREYEDLRATLEKSEHAAFGDNLYETILEEVSRLEGGMGIGELAAFTPPG